MARWRDIFFSSKSYSHRNDYYDGLKARERDVLKRFFCSFARAIFSPGFVEVARYFRVRMPATRTIIIIERSTVEFEMAQVNNILESKIIIFIDYL
jgi:hypothetical protein